MHINKKLSHTMSAKNLAEIAKKDLYEKQAETLKEVKEALAERGYDPTLQLMCYLISDDPTYITSHNGARYKMTELDRDEVVKMLIEHFFSTLS